MEEARKVQKTGRNTFIVSLPCEWVARRGVAKGEAVYLSENSDGSLSLSLKKGERGLKSCTVDVSSASFDVSMMNIVSAYVGGAGTIYLTGKGMNTVAEEARRILSGVEITEETEKELVLKILAFEDLSVDTILKRASSVTTSMFGLAAGQYREKADVNVEISRKEDEVDRLYLLLLRSFCVYSHPAKEAVFKAITAKSMEKISDHLEDLCKSGKEVAPNPQMANLVEWAEKVYVAAYSSFSNRQIGAREFTDAKDAYFRDLAKMQDSLKKEKGTAKLLLLQSLSEKCTKIVRYSEDIVESGGDIVFATMETEEEKP